MATESGYTVLPLSALKSNVTELFEALKVGTTVYVSKHGRITAAFRPRTFVPELVAAAYTSPELDLPTITARDIGRHSLSQVVADAEAGLPAAAVKDGHVYGILTPASTPRPDVAPDPDVVAARADAMLEYQTRHPDASADDIVAFSDSLESAQAAQAPPRTWPLSAEFDARTEIHDDIGRWRDQGSRVEDIVEEIVAALGEGLVVAECQDRPLGSIRPALAHILSVHGATVTTSLKELAALHGGFMPNSVSASIQQAEQREAVGESVAARVGYVNALAFGMAAARVPNVGVMWRLGNLARHTDRPAEAALWFRFSLAYDSIVESVEVGESVSGVAATEVC